MMLKGKIRGQSHVPWFKKSGDMLLTDVIVLTEIVTATLWKAVGPKMNVPLWLRVQNESTAEDHGGQIQLQPWT